MRLSALSGILSLALLACTEPGTEVGGQLPVLEFPEPGVDDPAAYEGYATRFFRDSRGNAVQVYLDASDGRVVHVWADAANESVAFTARDEDGRPAPLTWAGPGAVADEEGRTRSLRHTLAFDAGAIEIGWFLLGTMRLERDFQYFEWHLRPYDDPPLVPPELGDLVESLDRLPAEERASHLALLGAADVDEVRSRLERRVALMEEEGAWTVLVEQPSLDGRNRLTLELRGDAGASVATVAEDHVSVRALAGERVELDVTITTDSDALTPLGRDRLFNEAFEEYYADQRREADSLRQAATAGDAAGRLLAFRRFERQVLGLELLSYEEKLMASMPNYATYFGRDQMMSALMLAPISSVDVQEGVIASVLRKIDPSGNVSHEEGLGGQAIRRNAGEYAAAIRAWEETRETDAGAADGHLAKARALLENLQAVRENYNMVDDDFQLAVLVDRYLSRPDVPGERKRRFLTDPAGGGTPGEAATGAAGDAAGGNPTRLEALVRNLAFMSELAGPYAEEPVATNLVSFFHRAEDGWHAGSWRDSRAGYGNGRFAMDVNVVWGPEALASLEKILAELTALGLSVEESVSDLAREAPGADVDVSALEAYLRDPASLTAAVETWRGARRHFEVRLEPDEIRRRVGAALQALPRGEADFWRRRLGESDAAARPLTFLALSLDDDGRPIAAPNTDPATDLFLASYTEEILAGETEPESVLEMLDAFTRPFPVGLFVEELGPLVVNDAYASASVQERFREDLYHSPRVAWGREVNLLLLGLAQQIQAAYEEPGRLRDESDEFRAYVAALRRALDLTLSGVEASGLGHNELWSYRIEGEALRPVRYGVSSDIQLWNVTDLAVGFLLDRLPAPNLPGPR